MRESGAGLQGSTGITLPDRCLTAQSFMKIPAWHSATGIAFPENGRTIRLSISLRRNKEAEYIMRHLTEIIEADCHRKPTEYELSLDNHPYCG